MFGFTKKYEWGIYLFDKKHLRKLLVDPLAFGVDAIVGVFMLFFTAETPLLTSVAVVGAQLKRYAGLNCLIEREVTKFA